MPSKFQNKLETPVPLEDGAPGTRLANGQDQTIVLLS